MNLCYLLGLAVLDYDALGHPDLPDVLLAEEVPDLDEGAGLGDGAIDGEMSIHGPHLVKESLKIKRLQERQNIHIFTRMNFYIYLFNYKIYHNRVGETCNL